VIGNALDRGGGYTNALYRNHFDAHCGLEVVLPNGELLRTGMGAMPKAETWQQYKSGYGPWIDGLFSQTSLGVVTKMGIWLMPQPDAYLSGTVKVFRRADLIPLVEIMTRLENQEIYTGMPFFGSPLLGGLDPGDTVKAPPAPEVAAALSKPGEPDWAELERIAREKGTGFWGCKFQFYGPPKVVQAQWEYAKEQLSAIPDAAFEDGELLRLPLSDAEKEKVHKTVFGIPNLSIFFIGARSDANPNPTDGHMWFSPIIPRTGEAIFEAQKVFGEAARELGLPMSPLSLPGTYWRRAFIFIFGFPITHDPEVNKKNRAAFETVVRLCAEHGWGEYRTAPAFQDAVMETYSFNNHALRRFHETVKDAVDPNGILSAGHYGVWPRHLREKKA
jgi:4-cresol dehydrogenase (hydroxylating)